MVYKPVLQQIDLKRPEELLSNAEELFSYSELLFMRAVVLEAWAAFETYLYITVFSSLSSAFDSKLLNWIEKRSRNNIVDRVKILVPLALGRPIDKSLYDNFIKAKEIRNKVVHQGIEVSRVEAKYVKDTVYKLLAFLGSTVELRIALKELKEFFEKQSKAIISSEMEANQLIADFFSKKKELIVEHTPFFSNLSFTPDVILKFGDYNVVVETKYLKQRIISEVVSEAIDQIHIYLDSNLGNIGVLIIFYKGEVDEVYKNIQQLDDGKLLLLVIPQ
ncbi:MAG: hypothetical protein ACTSQ8_22615 [Candidatus Helarchaeota archaeon]